MKFAGRLPTKPRNPPGEVSSDAPGTALSCAAAPLPKAATSCASTVARSASSLSKNASLPARATLAIARWNLDTAVDHSTRSPVLSSQKCRLSGSRAQLNCA